MFAQQMQFILQNGQMPALVSHNIDFEKLYVCIFLKEDISTLELPFRVFGKLVTEGFRIKANILIDTTKLSCM